MRSLDQPKGWGQICELIMSHDVERKSEEPLRRVIGEIERADKTSQQRTRRPKGRSRPYKQRLMENES